jgi:hypothetical protein
VKRLATALFAFICLPAASHAARDSETLASVVHSQNFFLIGNATDARGFAQPLFGKTLSTILTAQGRNTRRRHARRTPSQPGRTPSPTKPANTPAGAGGSSSQPVQKLPIVRLDDSVTNAQVARPAGKSDDELAAEAFNASLNDALRKPLAGETRVRGVLTRIECVPEGLVFLVKAGDRVLRLSSGGFGGLHIIAFTPDAGTEMSCGPRKRESPAVITYRASAADAHAKTDGALVALEFVPAVFQLKQ